MSSLPPFQFATLRHTDSIPASSAPAAAPAAPGPILTWPAYIIAGLPLEPTREPAKPDDYELSWKDIDESDRDRFRRENAGRCYAAHYPYDSILDVYRRVFHSYSDDVQSGLTQPPADHHSGIFQRDIRQAEEDVGIIHSMPPAPPALQRANAEPGY
jgi:hypothetical protein